MMSSVTDIANYKRCRRRWDYQSSSRQNLTRHGMSAPALELGTLIHAALADWTTDPTRNADDYFAQHAQARLKKVSADYKAHNACDITDVQLLSLYESIELGMAMCANYQTRWKQPLGDNFVFASAEQEVIVDIPGTEHECECWTHNLYETYKDPSCTNCNEDGYVRHKLRAILDGLIRDNKGTHLILERKTYGQRPNMNDLEMNDQFMGYLWVCKQIGVPNIGGIAYDGLWKRKQAPKGSKFEDLFTRNIIKFYPQEINDWGVQLAHVVNEMASNPAIYPNRRWEGCARDCPFVVACQTQSRGEDIETYLRLNYVQRENTRPILTREEATV